ncbi:MAG TPA: DUF3567 family protein [Burkholderiales bacterium]|nr:DUF3567 family protein [Burkholderiales bacterium]
MKTRAAQRSLFGLHSPRKMAPSSLAGQARVMMNVIYDSDNYYVVEYSDQHTYELVDKRSARGTFFQGDGAARFMEFMRIAVGEDASVEHVDDFLDNFDILLGLRVVH